MSNEIKTIGQCKDEVAVKCRYIDWDDLVEKQWQGMGGDVCPDYLNSFINEAMQLYASQFQQHIDPEEAFVAGYKKRAEQSGLLYDFASELHSRSYYIKFKSEKLKR